MGKYLNAGHAHFGLRVLQSTLPYDTGNLIYNGTKMMYGDTRVEYTVGGAEADYFEILQENPKSKYFQTFEEDNARPVYEYLNSVLHGSEMFNVEEQVENDYEVNEFRQLPRREARLRASLDRSAIRGG